ncbi:MAG: amidohydrolase family protein [Candidatus Thorarchaeota archaeon]
MVKVVRATRCKPFSTDFNSQSKVLSLNSDFTFKHPIFDAHTHGIDPDSLDLLVSIQKKFGIQKAVLIAHSPGIMEYAKSTYPGRFIFAKYFSGTMRFTDGPQNLAKEILMAPEEGYDLVKMQSAPIMRARAKAHPGELRLDGDEMSPMFDAIREAGIPFILHLSDPDTYYASRYNDTDYFGTKERDLGELEGVLSRYRDIKFQIAHFAAQPEIHRLDNLSHWLNTYKNFNIDTSSARWISRELGRDAVRARIFLTQHSNRIHFGTDCVAFTDDSSYYDGRYLALRLLLESSVRNIPLPFQDADTVNSGGTKINGLELEKDVLQRIYWDNACKFYGF